MLEALEDRVTPTAVTPHGGPIMNHVEVENIFYGQAWNTPANQQLAAQINQFTAYLVQSPYMDMLNQYTGNGLLFGNNYAGRGSLYGSVVYEPAVSGTVKSTDIETTLIKGVLGPHGTGGGGLPALPTFNNLYIVYLPPGVSDDVAVNEGAYAYHSVIPLNVPPYNIPPDAPVPNQIQFIVAPYPGQGNAQPPYIPDPFQALTVAISHEVAESVTDPNLIWGDKYAQITKYGSGWYENTNFTAPNGQKVYGQEIGDLAQGYTGLLNGYLVQAEWSNAANGPVLPAGAVWKTVGSGSSNATGATTPGQATGPIGKPDSYQVLMNGSLSVNAAQGVLTNDTDVFHNPLQAVLVRKPYNGQLVYLAKDGSFLYVPVAGYTGRDSFTYSPSDGAIVGDTVTVTIDVTDPTTTVLGVSSTNVGAGQPVTLTATVMGMAAHSLPPQGTVTFFNGSTALGTRTLTDDTASLITMLPTGENSITAQYSGETGGDFVFNPSASKPATVIVTDPTTTVLGVASTNVGSGQSVTLTATVMNMAAHSNPPQGIVTFFNGSTALGTATLTNGTASIRTILPTGANSITVKYNGETGGNFWFNPSTSSPVTVTVSAPSGDDGGNGTGATLPPTLHTPYLLALFDQLLKGIETVNANGTETVTDNLFGFPLVSTYDGKGNLMNVTFFGLNITFLFA
jgi:hypothetical protein